MYESRQPTWRSTLCGAIGAALAAVLVAGALRPGAGSAGDAHAPAAQQRRDAFEIVGQLGGSVGAVAVPAEPVAASQGVSPPRHASIGLGPRLATLDVSDPARLAVVAESRPLSGVVRDIAMDGTRAYVLTGAALHVFDVGDPLRPVETGSVAVSGERVVVAGGYAYVPGGSNGLAIVDVRGGAPPRVVQRVSQASVDVVVRGGYAYVATGGSFGRVEIFDVSDASRAVPVSSYRPRLSGDDRSSILGVAVVGDYLYASGAGSAEGGRLRAVDITDPAQPREAGSYAPGCAGMRPHPMAHAGGSVLICGAQILDLADPAQPAPLARLALVSAPARMAVAGAMLYLAERPVDRAGAREGGGCGSSLSRTRRGRWRRDSSRSGRRSLRPVV